MSYNVKNVFILFFAILFSLSIFSACGTSDPGNVTQAVTESTAADATTAAAAEASTAAAADATTAAAAATTAAAAATTTAAQTAANVTAPVASGEMTEVGTPRNQTLIINPGPPISNPGQFNPYMTGTPNGFGLHNIFTVEGLWEISTITGESIPTVADGPAVHNGDFTEWTVKIRDGLKWSDGENLDANDVYFTFDTIMTNDKLVDNPYYNTIFKGAELVDDLTIKFLCKEPFTRLMTTLGVSMWGCGFRVIPEHIYKDVDITSFPDSNPVSGEAYNVIDYDELGNWILFEKRSDWADTPTGKVWGEPGPKYVLCRAYNAEETYVMAIINNEVDVTMTESSVESFMVMRSQNPNIRAWYADYPWATTDDPCAKGLFLNTGKEPFDNIDVRWALTLCCDYIEVFQNTLEGIGRASALSIPAITAMENYYYKPMAGWLTNEFSLRDGYKPWDPNFAYTLAAAIEQDFGYDLGNYDLIDIYGSGFWKTDKDKATQLMEGAGYTLNDGKWYTPGGELMRVNVLICREEDTVQASRAGRMVADQWEKFGVTVDLTMLNSTDMFVRYNMGDFDAAGAWDACSGFKVDIYNQINGWDDQARSYEIGELASGIASCRLPQSNPELSARISAYVRQIATMDPEGPEIQGVITEYLKLTTEAHVGLTVQSGTKLNPINTYYWTGFPTAEDPYEGPWWWWSLFRGILANVKPAQ